MTTHLRLVAELQAPWIVLVNNNNRRCRGLQCDLLNYLSRSLNFTYEISSTKEGPGLELANGSWTGLIGKIQSNEADMTASPVSISAEPFLQRIVDFSHQYNVEESVVLTRLSIDGTSGVISGIFFECISITLFFIAFTVILFLLVIINDDNFIQYPSLPQRFSNLFFELFLPLVYRGINLKTRNCPKYWTSIILVVWLSSCSLLSSLISTKITSEMSVRSPMRQIETIKELADSDLDIVAPPSFIGLQTIADKRVLSKLYDKCQKRHTIVSIADMLVDKRWVVDASLGKSAVFLYEVPLKQMIINFIQELNPDVRFRFAEERYGFPFILSVASSMRLSKGFRLEVNLKVAQYMSTGLLAHELMAITYKSQSVFERKTSAHTDSHWSGIALNSLIGPIKLCAVFWTISVLTVAVELVVNRKTSKRTKFFTYCDSYRRRLQFISEV